MKRLGKVEENPDSEEDSYIDPEDDLGPSQIGDEERDSWNRLADREEEVEKVLADSVGEEFDEFGIQEMGAPHPTGGTKTDEDKAEAELAAQHERAIRDFLATLDAVSGQSGPNDGFEVPMDEPEEAG